DLQAAISRLKAGTAPGSDGYTAEWYKEFKNDLIPFILPTLNWVLEKAQTPPSWKEAIISAIPKEGKDKTECASYRPISVLNIDYKMFTLHGYKVNVGKTQVLSYNYNPTSEMESKYPWSWQAKSFKYLGITIPKICQNYQNITTHLYTKKIKEDITRWNLIPFFSFSS